MKDRLHKLMEAEGLNSARFADAIGVQRSSISHILSGRNKPSYDFIVKILNRFKGLNADWLLTGQGSMIKGQENAQNAPNSLNNLFTDKQSQPVQATTNNSINTHPEEILTVKSDPPSSYASSNVKGSTRRQEIKGVTNVNTIKYILVFYEDGSFEQFKPRD